jgi:hypothetical protein
LKKQIREKRAELDPAILKKAQAAAEKSQGIAPKAKTPEKAPPGSVPPGTVPYDRKAALKAIELFLGDHADKGFHARLADFINRNKH